MGPLTQALKETNEADKKPELAPLEEDLEAAPEELSLSHLIDK